MGTFLIFVDCFMLSLCEVFFLSSVFPGPIPSGKSQINIIIIITVPVVIIILISAILLVIILLVVRQRRKKSDFETRYDIIIIYTCIYILSFNIQFVLHYSSWYLNIPAIYLFHSQFYVGISMILGNYPQSYDHLFT